MTDAPAPFVKTDQEKPRMDLLPVLAIERVAEVLTFGAKKYAPDNWRRVDDLKRYYAAALRHIFASMRGEKNDPETGKSHMTHAACCILFIVELEK